ncbi:MAG: cadherin repeat domain-containing protein [Verrucomicrobiales bacterium]
MKNYPRRLSGRVYWEDGGKDVEFWLGFYGAIFDAALLEFADPAPTGIHLTPGSYPVSATAGGVAGILTTDDNPGSTHTYDLVADTSEQLIVQRGANWRYTDTDVDLSALDWKAPSGTEAGQFDDSGWSQGFAELGYGENDEATPINGEGNVIAHYFRHEFSIAAGGLDNLTGLTLRLKRDDGAVVYLNGQEIARDNMPAGPIDAFTLAAGNASDDGANFHEFTVPLALLQEGVNTLAAEVHQAALTSSDVSFDLELAAQQIAEDYDNALFAIDGDRVIFAQDASSLPVTVGATWTIQVRTTDDAGNHLSERLTITGVEDPTEPPTDITLDPATLVEDELPGTLVGVFTTADADVGDLHSYTFAAGEGDADNSSFTISADRLLTAEIFDAGVQSSYSIRVRSTDSAGLSVEKALAVTITNKNDPPTDIQLSASQVPGSADADTLIGTLSTDDPDNPLGETHTYAVLPLLGATPIFGFGSEWRFLDTGTSLDAENWTTRSGGFRRLGLENRHRNLRLRRRPEHGSSISDQMRTTNSRPPTSAARSRSPI